MTIVLFLFFLAFAPWGVLLGQDGFDFKQPFSVSGSLGLNTGFYTAFGAPSRRDPFSYLLNANINFKVLGMIDVPFSANFSQQEAAFRQPFNQYGISPTYKWATLHLGYRNMTFSDFSLAGHTFLGAGMELKPGPWRISAVYGRFRRAVDEATALEEGVDPAFRRIGYGLQFGYEAKGDQIAVSVFSAHDDPGSISIPVENDKVTPESNLVLGLTGKKSLGKKLSLDFDLAQSAITRDTRSPISVPEGGFGYFGGVFKQRSSSQTRPAFSGNLDYKGKTYKVGLSYRRVDTDYRTLGAYFFNNDVEELTVKLNKRLLKGKVNLNASGGGQRNDLKALKATRSSRLVGALNLSVTPAPAWSFSLNYSNFSSFLKVQQDLLSDSLNFYQITRNLGFNAAYMFGSKESPHNLGFTASYQSGLGRTEYSIDPENSTDFLNLALSYRVSLKAKGISFNSAMSFASSSANGLATTFFGPVAGITKAIWGKKGKVGYRSSFQKVLIQGQPGSSVLINAVNGSLQLFEKHGLSAGVQHLVKSSTSGFSELRGTVGYMFQF